MNTKQKDYNAPVTYASGTPKEIISDTRFTNIP